MIQQDDDLERRLTAWLRADAPDGEPPGLLRVVAARTARTRRRPGWAIAARWAPAIGIPVPRLRYASHVGWLFAIMAVVLAIAAGLLAVGSLPRLPAPVGPARAGLIAFDSGGDIVVVNPDGSDRRNLTSSPALETSPSFSPDGTTIAYWTKVAEGLPASLWVMNADGSDPHDVTGSTDFSGNENIQAAWSPDSRRLAFSVGDYYSSSRLYVVGADGTGLHEVGGGSLSRSDPAWSPDGSLIAFRGHTIGLLPDAYPADPAIGVYVIGPDGTRERKVGHSKGAGGAPNFGGFGGPSAGTAPSWSPDGRSLLFATGPSGHHVLAIAAVDGSSERVIELPAGDDLLPIFSPDGTRIAFIDLTAAGDQATVFVVNPDGIGLWSLDGGTPIAPNPLFWSPDGRFVATYAVDLAAIHLSPADRNGTGAAVVRLWPPVVAGALFATGFAERASWQRLAP